jgi:hypothetical protein
MAKSSKQPKPSSPPPSETGEPERNGEEREKGSPPVYSRRAWTGTGTVEVAVFERMVESESGDRRVFHVVAKRTWKDGDEYKSSNVFRPEDLLPLSLFLQFAYAFITNENSKR